jgi:N-acetylglucosamine-6-sulfatase
MSGRLGRVGGPYSAPALRYPRIGLALTLLLVACSSAGCGGGDSGTDQDTRIPAHPNILVVMTDDQAFSGWMEEMPTVRREVVERGTTFERSFVSNPLCCPSRATFMTGQYGHNNGVLDNYPGYPALRRPDSVLPAWLQGAGYRTGHVGKWLHQYDEVPDSQEGAKPPPGWDEWDGLMEAKYYEYWLSVNGTPKRFGDEPSEYANEVITDYGLRFLRDRARGPFFLWLAYVAPHVDKDAPAAVGPCAPGNAIPTPADAPNGTEPGFPRSRSVNEEDVSDKPSFLRELPRLRSSDLDVIDNAFRCEQASMRAVDRGVARIIEELRRSGDLDRTLIMFTSDHGFFHGEHRVSRGKSLPYSPVSQVPLAIKPPVPPGSETAPTTSDALVANIDLAPTILDYAGGAACVDRGDCRMLDGLSLRPLIDGDDEAWPTDRAILQESRKRSRGVCGWSALRTRDYLYGTYRAVGASNDRPCSRVRGDLYDLGDDPLELENILEDPGYSDVRDELAKRLAELKNCSGEECR